jgi:hypothetical protein
MISLKELKTSSSTPTLAIRMQPIRTNQYGDSTIQHYSIVHDQLSDENHLLRHVVRNLWQLYRYHQEYESFLLGGCSETEFLAAAEQYATVFQNMPIQSLIFASSLLLDILDIPLTSSDLSVLLNVDPFHIEQILSSSSQIHAVQLEHRNSHGEQR